MKFKKLLLVGITALAFGVSISTTAVSANHDFIYWERPHWVTVTKTSTIYKIYRTYPLVNSYVVKKYRVYPGHHLRVHHAASYSWMVESGHFNSNSYYTYAVKRLGYSWFKQGIY